MGHPNEIAWSHMNYLEVPLVEVLELEAAVLPSLGDWMKFQGEEERVGDNPTGSHY